MRRGALLVLGATLLCALPPAAAGTTKVPIRDFEGDVVSTSVGRPGADERQFTVATGQFEFVGPLRGLVSISETRVFLVAAVPRLDVYESTGPRSPPRLVHTVLNGQLTAASNASLYYHTEGVDHTMTVQSRFAFAVPLNPPEQIELAGVPHPMGPSLAVIGDAAFSATPIEPGTNATVLVPRTNATSLTVRAGPTGAPTTFNGTRYHVRLAGGGNFVASAGRVTIPFLGSVSARVLPVADATARAKFDPAQLNLAIEDVTPGAPRPSKLRLDPRVLDPLRSLSAVFNGVLTGNAKGNATIGGDTHPLGDFTLVRFEELRLSPNGDQAGVRFAGSGRFLLAGEHLYATAPAVGPGSFRIPILALALWTLAGAALVLARVRKPFLSPSAANAAPVLRRFARIVQVGGLILGLVLWDYAVRSFLGTSLLHAITTEAGGLPMAFAGILQLLTYGTAFLFFGLPLRFILNVILQLAHMRRLRGVGRGLAHVATWGLGAVHLPILMDPFLTPILDRVL